MKPELRSELIGKVATAGSESVSIERLKQVYIESITKELVETSYLPDYLLIEMAERYGVDCKEYKLDKISEES